MTKRLQHVNFWWLKEPDNHDHRKRLVAAAEALRAIPGVQQVLVGPRAQADWSGIDDTYDFGMIVTFDSLDTLSTYLPHPLHQKAVEVSLEVGKHFHAFYFNA